MRRLVQLALCRLAYRRGQLDARAEALARTRAVLEQVRP